MAGLFQSASRQWICPALVAVGVSCVTSVPARAQTLTWSGSVSSDWFILGNWSDGVPSPVTAVVIDTTFPNATVISSGTATSGSVVLGAARFTAGMVTVVGAGAAWVPTGDSFIVGGAGTGTVVVSDGALLDTRAVGTVTVAQVLFSLGSVTLTNGGTWTTGGVLDIGVGGGYGTLTIGASAAEGPPAAPGFLNATSVTIGDTIEFHHTSGNYTFDTPISGPGRLDAFAGVTTLNGANTYTSGTGVYNATLRLGPAGSLGAAGTQLSIYGGTVDLNNVSQTVGHLDGDGAVTLGSATLTVVDVPFLSDPTFSGGISGTGGIVVRTGLGTLTLSGTNAYTGPTTIDSGNLRVNGTLATVSVVANTGTRLEGTGSIVGTVTIGGGATLAPGASEFEPGTLTLGSLALDPGSFLAFDLGEPDTLGSPLNDRLQVVGNVALGGTLNVADSGVFATTAGSYRLIDYTGTLTGALGLGTLPGHAPGTVFVQTVVGGQVNLIATGGLATNFWDGPATTPNVIEGGAGTWKTTVPNWTNVNGTFNQSYLPGLTIFQGASGTVTLGDDVSAQVLQFATDGYTIAGAGHTLTLLGETTGGPARIRVDSGARATIAAPLAGSVGLVAEGGGTLVFTGTNTYTGGTTVTAGTLLINGNQTLAIGQTTVASGATLGGTGTIGGTVIFDPGSRLAPGGVVGGVETIGTLQVVGDLTLSGTTQLAYQLGALGASDLVTVGGALLLDGLLQVTPMAGFGLGRYSLFNYGGGLTDNALTLPAAPGTLIYNLDTTVPGDVALVVTGAPRAYWDGSDTTGNGIVNGGSGTWTNTTLNWTNADGTSNGPWAGTIAVFQGPGGGIVTLGEPVTVTGVEFSGAGYVVQGPGSLQLGSTTATIDVAAGMEATISASISDGVAGATLTKLGDGTLTLAGANTYTGATTISDGAVRVTGTLASVSVVAETGTKLEGTGSIGGMVTIGAGATLAPGAGGGGTLTLGGLILDPGSFLAFDLGEPDTLGSPLNDRLQVMGNVALGGTLNVTDSGVFATTAGSYRLIDYTGTLTGALGLGTLPGHAPGTVFVQTVVGGQVNLIATGGLATNFWDGPATTPNVIEGGAGIWNTTLPNWTNVNGTFNQSYLPGLAIFQGAAGTVTLGDDVSAQVLQFATDGYTIAGAGHTLTLLGETTTGPARIRVDSGATATIAAPLAGSVGLVVGGGGTLVLTGTNTYTGGTMITAGTLRLGTGGSLVPTEALAVNAGATFDLNGVAQTVGDLSGAGVIALGTGTLTAGAAANTIFAGVISGTGALFKQGAGILTLAGANTFTGGTTVGAGTLRLGPGGNVAATGALTVNAGATFALNDVNQTVGDLSGAGAVTLGSGTLTAGAAANTTFAGVISGTGGFVKQGPGMLTLTGAHAYTGATTIGAGTLLLAGSLANTSTTVAANATLGGSGTIGGSVTVLPGGHLAPGIGAALGTGPLVLHPNAQLDYTLTAPGTGGFNSLLEVAGDLTLNGVLNLTPRGTNLAPGLYRLINYTGAMTDPNGTLTFGDVGGLTESQLSVQTAVKGQVNLLNDGGLTLFAWDGGNPAFHHNGQVNGGDGIWNTANTNWTNSDGAANRSWTSDALALFESLPAGVSAATVIVDASAGPVTFGGLQFATGGYTIAGQPIVTNTATTIVRVGDGTFAGADFTGTIAAPIVGSGGIVKTDLGTLVLTGNSLYTGGTTISGGILQLGNGGSSGSILGDILDNAALVVDRSDTLTIGNRILGTGTLTQAGQGTTILTNVNPYTGGTTIAEGTLVATNVGALGTGRVLVNAALEFRIDGPRTGTFGNTLTGSGSLTKTLDGTVALTASGSTVGEVSIEAGQLTLAQSGAFTTNAGGFTIGNSAAAALTPSATLDVQTSFSVDTRGTLIVELPSGTRTPRITAGSANLGSDSTLVVAGWTPAAIGKASEAANRQYTLISTRQGIAGDFAHVTIGAGVLPDYLLATAGKDATGRDYNLNLGLRWYAALPDSFGTFTVSAGAPFDVDVALVDVTPNPAFRWDGKTLTKAGAGTLTLSASNSYTGLTGILGGTVALAGAGDIAASAGVDLAMAGTTFTIAAADGHRTIQDLFGVAGTTVALGTNTLTAGTANGTMFEGTITGSGGFTKQGTGIVLLNGVSPFTGPTTIHAGALVVGDAAHRDAALSGGGPVTIDASTLLGGYGRVAGNVLNRGVVAVGGAAPGAGSDSAANFRIGGTLTNAGLLQIGSAGFGNVLTTGGYVGQSGTIALNTTLGSDDAPSDRLVVDGGSASGTTRLHLSVAGAGALTTGDGILLVEAVNGATTSPGAFTIDQSITTPIFDYALHHGGLGASRPANWFLRSTYRAEASLYAAAAPAVILYGQTLFDTLHERVGDEERLRDRTDLKDSRWLNGAWGRVVYRSGDWDGGGLTADGPPFEYRARAIQGGADLLRREHDRLSRDHAGVMGAGGLVTADVTSDAGEAVGQSQVDVATLGGYWTHFGRRGWYVDGIVQFSWLDATLSSSRTGVRTSGTGAGASLEGGYPFALSAQTVIEPQAQLVYQRVGFDTASDALASVQFPDAKSLAGRLGVRVSHDWTPTPGGATTWGRVSVWHEYDGDSQIRLDATSLSTVLRTRLGGSWVEFSAGGDLPLGGFVTIYGSGGYATNAGDSPRHAASGKGGVRFNW